MSGAPKAPAKEWSIWWFAFGYFASYVPYAALDKSITQGLISGHRALTGFEVLPLSALASLVGMLAFLTWKSWWKYATHKRIMGLDLPVPTIWTGLSGVCTAVIIMTTTLAYTFKGVSIVFMMLLLRGGVLVIAPVVDLVARRRVHWYSWAGLALGLLAAIVPAIGADYVMTLACGINVIAYLGAYFFRLQFMSRKAKSADPNANLRYFVEEQIVGTPLLVIALGVCALIGGGGALGEIRSGFVGLFSTGLVPHVLLIGLFSQGTGIFGGLVLLDKRENTFSVPVNRTSSILAGIVASFLVALIFHVHGPQGTELIGAALIVAAILFLTIPPMMKKRSARVDAAAATSRA